MTQTKQAPDGLRGAAGATRKFVAHYKDTKISLSKLQYSLFCLLSDGRRYSSHKIMEHIRTSDPRKEVQYLRRKGINVQDEWVARNGEIPCHKRYFIDPNDYHNE